jgi:hypothetical protein
VEVQRRRICLACDHASEIFLIILVTTNLISGADFWMIAAIASPRLYLLTESLPSTRGNRIDPM